MKSKVIRQLPKPVRDDLYRLGLLVRDGRHAKGLTQGDLAARLQISPTTVRAVEQGDPAVASGILVAILWLLGIGPVASIGLPQIARWAKTRTGRKRVRRKALDDF